MSPRPFGKYLLDREIAHGGMARVHLARLRGLGGFEKRLVLKEIHPSLASDPRFVALFVEEAKTLVEMSHPHIVPVYELGIVEGTYFLAMEHVRGATLEQLVADGPLEPEEAAHVGAQVADALAYAHERFSLVHRDVTPRNVMIDGHGHARLLDFGIAARLEAGGEGDVVFGTPGYLSPEQARGERLTPRSDLFSLGAVLYRACTGRHAFSREVEDARAMRVLPELPLLDALPDELARTIRAALAPDPADRPSSGKAMAAQLRAFLAARRPEGVADALGAQAERIAAREEHAPDGTPSTGPATPAAKGSTQSLATSPVLVRLLETPPRGEEATARADEPTGGTVRIARRGDAAGAATQDAEPAPASERVPSATTEPSTRASWARAGLLTVVAGSLAMWATSMARFDPPTRERPVLPVDPTPLERDPPDAGLDAPPLVLDAGDRGTDAGTPIEPEDAAPSRAPRDARPRAEPSPETTAATRAGHLTVQALPWADVSLDGRPVGRTPMRELAVSAGDHELVLSCPPLGREVRRTVHVDEGARVRIGADLQASPPTITER
jgi:serine/threonine-protein kinase